MEQKKWSGGAFHFGAVREVATSPYRVERNAREFHGDSDASGSATVVPTARRTIRSRPSDYTAAALLLLMLLASRFYSRRREGRETPVGAIGWKRAVAFVCLALLLNGCGGGSSGNSIQQPAPPPPAIVTPSGTYTLTVTPSATPAGSTKSFLISPISLTLVVK